MEDVKRKKIERMPAFKVLPIFEDDHNALQGLDPSFLKENPHLVNAYENIQWDDVSSLNGLVGAIEKVVVKYKNPNESIKRGIEKVYNELLRKYPLFFGYWKRFTAVEYQLYGLEKSIETLQKSVQAFPTSLELWCDYLNVLCTNNSNEIDLIRSNFQAAKASVGWQFLSHPFWDKYIEFESKHKELSNLKSIYEELVTIPLHQYAKYGASYREFLRTQNLHSDINRLAGTIKATQAVVTAIWPYESKIKQSFFTLAPVSNEEIKNWDEYLDFLQTNQEKFSLRKDLIKAVFERCLIPCLYYEHFWIKFISWFEKKQTSEIKHTVELFERGTAVLPTTSKAFRVQLLQYLKRNFRRDKTYIFTIFTQTIASYMELWPGESSLMSEYLALLKRFKFGSAIDQRDKEILSQQTSYSKFLESALTNYLQGQIDRNIPLQEMINDSNFAIVVVELLKSTWLVLKNTMQTRKYFNLFGKNPLLRSSVSFWLTYYKFEKSNQNFTKLNKFINDLGTEIFLPTTIINDILSDYQSFYLINASILDFQGQSTTTDNAVESSVVDPIFLSQLKINNPTWRPGSQKNNLDWHKTREFKENGHVGIIDEKPQISNIIIEEDSKSFGNILPPLPTFRNLEKINQPVKYENILDKDYLKIEN